MINRFRRGFDPGFLVVLLICLLAVWPLLSRASLPEGTDAELHIFRLHELSYLIRGGEIYPRWAPNFYHGYGYPIFNYYAPLTYYLALPLELLPGIDAVAASKALLIAGMLMGGLGIYGYVRDLWDRRAGYVAAALYVYSPYIQYIDPHMRGALPEAFSFGVFPLALWALDRLRRRPTVGTWVASGLLTAAVILSHNLMGLFFFGMLVLWCVWQAGLLWWDSRHSADIQSPGVNMSWLSIVRPSAALMLALGLAAFFWLPVVLERNAVTLNTLIGAGDNYDFRTHFVSLAELFGLSMSPDWGATQSPFRFNLGVAQWVGGLIGVVMAAMGRVRERRQLSFFIFSTIGIVFLMISASQSLWEAIPLLPFFQFPWRLLGAAAVMLAVLGGAGAEALIRSGVAHEKEGDNSAGVSRRDRRVGWAYAFAVAVPIFFGLSLSQPAPWASFGEVNTLRMSLIENSGRWLGTTSTADYVPAKVITLPARRGSVVEPITSGLPPDRVNREAMPAGAEVATEAMRPLWTRYHVVAPKQFRLRLYQFDFPGWHVTIDGEPAQTEIAEPEGFIVVLVPEGSHVVDVKFGSTPPRTIGWVISGVSFLILVAGAWRIRKALSGHISPDTSPKKMVISADLPIILVAGGITLLAILAQPLGLFHASSSGRELDLPAVENYVNFGDQIALLGYDMPEGIAHAGETLDLTLYWRALRQLGIDYQSFVHIADSDGKLIAQSDNLNPGEFPTRRWPLDKYVPDTHSLVLPENIEPGEYKVLAGLWVQSDGWRLAVFDEGGQAIDDRAEIATLKVE